MAAAEYAHEGGLLGEEYPEDWGGSQPPVIVDGGNWVCNYGESVTRTLDIVLLMCDPENIGRALDAQKGLDPGHQLDWIAVEEKRCSPKKTRYTKAQAEHKEKAEAEEVTPESRKTLEAHARS